VVIGVLAIASVVGLLFFLRRRKAASKAAAAAPKEGQNPYLPPTYTPVRELGHGNVHEVGTPAQEVVGDTVKYRHELETRMAELEGERAGAPKR
jgi:flagellar basal body-associated protein FliL